MRPFCFSLIQRPSAPESFAIVLNYRRTIRKNFKGQKFILDAGTGRRSFINIRYEDQVLYCVTGLSMNQFTMDRSLEREWDDSVKAFYVKRKLFLRKARACIKIHSRHLHASLRGIFGPNSLTVAHYAALIRAKSPTKSVTHI